MEVCAQDWPNLYEKNYQTFRDACHLAVELEEQKQKKQEMYIYREQEYRKTIEDLEKHIDLISQKPLAQIREQSEDQIQLENIKIQLNAAKAGGGKQEEEGAAAFMREYKPDAK